MPLQPLVTGASGFLGGRLTRLLCAQGLRVRIIVRETSNLDHLAGLPLDIIRAPLTNLPSGALDNITHIYHCAGASTDWAPYDTYYQANVLATQALLFAARASGRIERFLHISTTDVYGYPRTPCDESHSRVFTGLPYNETKCLGEAAVFEAGEKTGLPVTILRPATIYGPRGTAFVTDIVRLLREGSMALFDSGRTRGGFTYVDNVCHAILAAASSPNTLNRAYNITDDTNITWKQYVHALADGLGLKRPWLNLPSSLAIRIGYVFEKAYSALPFPGRPLLTRHAVLLLARDQEYPTHRARQDFQYNPPVSFNQAMTETIEWARNLLG